MKKQLIKIAIAALTLIVTILPLTFGWFASQYEVEEANLSAETIASYFAAGSGTQEDPFIIATAKHLYNLSWLQNRGYIDSDKTETPWRYFRLNPDFYADNGGVLDMAGMLPGDGTKTGAIPPIGTKDNPFTGFFDGNGSTIANLWVSTDPDDWKEQPEEYQNEDYHYGVGLFGYLEKHETEPTYVGNFYLKNIEVTCSIHTDELGLVAGYVDCSMNRIGVENGIFTFKNGYEVSSTYSLIGTITDDVIWTDNPINGGSGAGGDLIINPTFDESSNISSGKTAVPKSVSGTAYYIGTLNRQSPKNIKNVFKLNTSGLSFNGSKTTYTITKNNSSNATINTLETEFQNAYNNGTRYMLKPGGNINFNNVTSFNTYPTNCVWFQPQNGGTCAIAFMRENNSSDEKMSLFRYQRNSDGSFKSSSLQEVVFAFAGNAQSVGNKCIVYFELTLSEEEALNYEYCIGMSSGATNATAGFFFLKLAGTDISHGADPSVGTYKILNKIEFVNFNNLPYFIFQTYAIDMSGLKVEGTFTDGARLQYHEFSDGNVHYYNSTGSGLTITEQVTANFESQSDNNLSGYPTRDDE